VQVSEAAERSLKAGGAEVRLGRARRSPPPGAPSRVAEVLT
jgi:hypothetical protein